MIPLIFIFCSCMQEEADEPQPTPESTRIDSRGPIVKPDNDCLVAFYPFNGNANDMSSYDNHGIVDGPVLTTDRNGYANKAYYFDGLDDIIVAPDQSQLHLQDEFTISSWILPETVKSQFIVRKGPVVNGAFATPYALGMSGTRDIVFHLSPNGIYNSIQYRQYRTGIWYMLTVVYKNGMASIYINKTLVSQEVIPTGTFNYDAQPLLIGSRLQQISNTFKGKIDEVRIYCKALTAREVGTLHTETAPTPRGG